MLVKNDSNSVKAIELLLKLQEKFSRSAIEIERLVSERQDRMLTHLERTGGRSVEVSGEDAELRALGM